MTLSELQESHPTQFGMAFILKEPTVEGLVLVLPNTPSIFTRERSSVCGSFYQVFEELRSEPGVFVGAGPLTDEELDSVDWEVLGYLKLRAPTEDLEYFQAQKIVKL